MDRCNPIKRSDGLQICDRCRETIPYDQHMWKDRETGDIVCSSCAGEINCEAIAAWNNRVGVAESATTTADEPEDADGPEDATVEGIVRSIVGWADKAKAHTKDEYVLGCLDQIANWTSSIMEVVSKTEKTTNAAKMCEALVLIANIADCLEASLRRDNVLDGYVQDAGNIRNIARDALAAPPRNCDRFNTGNHMKDVDDAYDAWQRYCDDPTIPPSCKVESAFKYWLFAKAKEEVTNEQ